MDAILDELGQLLLEALPTLLLLVILHFYLKWVFYRPLDRVLQQRHDATEGARRAAEESLARAEEKAAEYEASLQAARTELYLEQDAARKRLAQQQSAALAEARKEAEAMVSVAKDELALEAERARQGLRAESEALAEQIAGTLLERRAS